MRSSGGTMFGNCDTGRLIMETAPMITSRMEITIATMGRSMKKRLMRWKSVAGRVGGFARGQRHVTFGIYSRAFLRSKCAFDDDFLARFETFLDEPAPTDLVAHLHQFDVGHIRAVCF